MTGLELKLKVTETVQRASFAGGTLALFDRCLGEIAARCARERKILPGLEATATVATVANAAYVALPANYGRGLYWVGSALQKRRVGDPARYHNFTAFLRRFPDPALSDEGPVREVCVKGANLYYQGRQVDTLTLHYFIHPPAVTEEGEVTCLPSHLVESLLVNYACREIYNLIEDGQEDRKTNTKVYDGLYQRALAQLLEELEDSREEAAYIEDLQ